MRNSFLLYSLSGNRDASHNSQEAIATKTYRQCGGYNTADLEKAIKDDNVTLVETILKDPS